MPTSPDTLFQDAPFTWERLYSTSASDLYDLAEKGDRAFQAFASEHLAPLIQVKHFREETFQWSGSPDRLKDILCAYRNSVYKLDLTQQVFFLKIYLGKLDLESFISLAQAYQEAPFYDSDYNSPFYYFDLTPQNPLFVEVAVYGAKQCAEKLGIPFSQESFDTSEFWSMLLQAKEVGGVSLNDTLAALPFAIAAPLIAVMVQQVGKISAELEQQFCVNLLQYKQGELLKALFVEGFSELPEVVENIMKYYDRLSEAEQKALCGFSLTPWDFEFINKQNPAAIDNVLARKMQANHDIVTVKEGKYEDLPILDVIGLNALPKTLKAFIDRELAKESGDKKLNKLLSHTGGYSTDANIDKFHVIVALTRLYEVSDAKIDCCLQLIELSQKVDWSILNLFNHPNSDAIIYAGDHQNRDAAEYALRVNGYNILRLYHEKYLPIALKVFDLFLTALLNCSKGGPYSIAKSRYDYVAAFNEGGNSRYEKDRLNSNDPAHIDMTRTLSFLKAICNPNANQAYTSVKDIPEVDEGCTWGDDLLAKYVAPRAIINRCLKEGNSSLRETYFKLLLLEAQKPFAKGATGEPNFDFFAQLPGLDEQQGAAKRQRRG